MPLSVVSCNFFTFNSIATSKANTNPQSAPSRRSVMYPLRRERTAHCKRRKNTTCWSFSTMGRSRGSGESRLLYVYAVISAARLCNLILSHSSELYILIMGPLVSSWLDVQKASLGYPINFWRLIGSHVIMHLHRGIPQKLRFNHAAYFELSLFSTQLRGFLRIDTLMICVYLKKMKLDHVDCRIK